MNRRPMLLASLILFGTTLLVLTVATSIHPQAAAAHPALVVNQSAVHAPLYTASPIWTNVPITNAGLDGTQLNAVTVDSAGTVWAVGFYPNSMVIISSTNGGSSWYTFTQNLGTSSELWGVAAVSPNSIFAVGDYIPTNSSKAKTLVMHYNGSGWSQVPSVDFTNRDSRLLAVAATANGEVWAAGRLMNSNGLPISTLVERWDSATSSFVDANFSITPRTVNILHGVALTAPNNVWVVGESDARALIAHWNGTSWIYTSYQPDANTYAYYGVALDPNASARVGGYRQVNGVGQPLMTRYSFNGSAISLDSAFTDTRLSGDNYLYGVAVSTTNDVWAGGNYTLTEHYDGLSWESMSAELVGSFQQSFYGVAVDPVRDGAWAAGHYSNGTSLHPLVERYARPVMPQPPKYTVSYYVVDPKLLYDQGANAKFGITSGIVILEFGKPAAKGTLSGTILPEDLSGNFYPLSKVAAAVENFADGYYNGGQPVGLPQPITIAIGTSNYKVGSTDVMTNASTAYDHGQAWAQMVNQVDTYVYTKGYSSLIRIAGASDMEIDWNDPDKTTAWANGFNAAAISHRYYNFGDCAGCPYNMSSPWTYTDVYRISWGIQAALPFPQIYTTDAGWARQWQQVELLTRNSVPYGRMTIAGSLTQRGSCITHPCDPIKDNSPSTGWVQLWQALNFDPLGRTAQALDWASDITYNTH